MTDGIYTLANDVVYDQLVALLNSIEANVGSALPVYVIAYDDQLDKVRAEIEKRQNVHLFNESEVFARWEEFSAQVWSAHPTAMQTWREWGIPSGVHRLGMNRRYCAFDPESPLERFIYFDADVLVLDSLKIIFDSLDQNDFVVYDFQYKDPSHIYNLKSPKLFEIFDEARIRSEIFCAGMYAAKRGLLGPEQRDFLVSKLNEGEADVLYTSAPNQSVLNYLVMRSNTPVYNLALQLPKDQSVGCSVTSPHFENQANVLYDRGNRLSYLHYIGLSSKLFRRVCAGENVGFPYRDLFLHYRYLHEPEQRPKFTTKPKPYNQPPNLATRALKKLGLVR